MRKSAWLILVVFATVLLWAPLYPVLAQTEQSSDPNRSVQRKLGVVEEKRDEITKRIADFRLKLASREAVLKERLAKFTNQNRAQIAQRASEALNRINQTRTDGMLKHLDVLNEILAKAEQRASGSASESASTQAIASASASIAAAKTAVNLQSQKDYTINVTTDASLQPGVRTKRDGLLKDLGNMRKLILDTKTAVVAAIRAVGKEKGPL